MKNRLSILFYVFVAMTGSLAVNGDQASAATTELVSIATGGTQGNSSSDSTAISADGRYVAFKSAASNLVTGDTNGAEDVFVHDRETNTTERVSIATNGTQANDYALGSPTISADGRYVAFASMASNLVPGDTNGSWDIFVRDRETNRTERVSIATDGTQANDLSESPRISADGRYVVFISGASNLVSNDTNSTMDIFVRDRVTRVTERVSVSSTGAEGNGVSYTYTVAPGISDDGRYVAFRSKASNLVPGDTNAARDVFVHDRQTGNTERVSIASDGTEGDNDSYDPVISGDGRYVAFFTDAANLVDDSAGGGIFIHDRDTKTTKRVSSEGICLAISGDGRYVAFEARGLTLASDDIFVYDSQTDVTDRVSTAADGTQGNGSSDNPSISADGRYVAFSSMATNLVSGDTNGVRDIFVLERTVDLSILKQAPATVTAGSVFDYVLSVTNNDSITATGVTITDALPQTVSFLSASSGCSESGGTVTCSLGAVPKGTTSQATITVRAGAAEVITNTASVSAEQADPNTENNSSSADTAVGKAPVLDNQTFSIAENSIISAVVGTVEASDPDGDTLTFAVTGGTSPNPFTINSATGQLTVADGSQLDYETTRQFLLVVQATDSLGLSDSGIITINVTNINEKPTSLSLSNSSVAENTSTAGGYGIGTLSTTDPDVGDTFTYNIVSVPSEDSTLFSIGGAGNNQLILTDGELDYETKSSYSVTVRSTDSGGLFIDQSFTITVTDVDEADLALSISSDAASVEVDGLVIYTAAVTNNDTAVNATGVTITDTLPAGVTFDSASAGCANASGTVTCDLGTLPAGATNQVTITVRTDSSGDITNTATVSTDQVDPDTSNNTAGVSIHVNAPPTISPIPDLTIDEDTSLAVAFTIGDAETAATALTVTCTSLDTALVDVDCTGTDAAWTVTMQPVLNQTGTAGITVSVSDGTATAVRSFNLTVNPVNDGPSIDPIVDQVMDMLQTSITVTVKVGDIDTDPGTLTVSAVSGNTDLVPQSGLTLDPADPTGINWTLTVTPASGQWGDTEITVAVSDGTATASTSFTLAVNNTYVCNDPLACPDGTVVTPAPGVTVKFSEVTAGGSTSVETSTTDPGPVSEGFIFLGTYYDIITTAALVPDTPITICLSYIDIGLPVPEDSLQISHLVGGVWTPVDEAHTIRYPADNIICGIVNSLSWFGIGYDNTPPTFTLNRLKDTLWPPNHKMVKVARVTNIADNNDPSPAVDIRVSSTDVPGGKDKHEKDKYSHKGEKDEEHGQKHKDKEDDDAEHGNDRHAPDWKVRKKGGTWEVWVRAERTGDSTDRIYTITATVTDRAGNQATDSHTVLVPHDKNKKETHGKETKK